MKEKLGGNVLLNPLFFIPRNKSLEQTDRASTTIPVF